MEQETQLSLTNRETHLCKCNEVTGLNSVIKICLKKNDSSHPAFQGHSRSLKQTRIDPPSMISYLCFLATLSIKHTVFEILDFKNAVTFKTGLGVRQCHWKCPPFD